MAPASASEVDMKKLFGAVILTSLLLACSTASPAGISVMSPDSWVEADALAAAQPFDAVAVAGYESSPAGGYAALDPAPAPAWEVTEGHVTIVNYDETP
jgi:hypothetical protein